MPTIPHFWDWIDERQGKENLYFHVNQLQSGLKDIKAKRKTSSARCACTLMWDNPEALPKITEYIPKPTVIIPFGRGISPLLVLKRAHRRPRTDRSHKCGIS